MGRLSGVIKAAVVGTVVAVGWPTGASAADDAWWGRDKALHASACFVLGAGGYAAARPLGRPWQRAAVGLGIALGAGVAKELWDLGGHGTASGKDLAWDAIGAGVGVGLAWGIDRGVEASREDAAGDAGLQAILTAPWRLETTPAR